MIAIHGGLGAVPAPPASSSKTPQKTSSSSVPSSTPSSSIPSSSTAPSIPSIPPPSVSALSSSDLANAYLQQIISPRTSLSPRTAAAVLPKTTPGRLHNHFISNLNYDSPNKVLIFYR